MQNGNGTKGNNYCLFHYLITLEFINHSYEK